MRNGFSSDYALRSFALDNIKVYLSFSRLELQISPSIASNSGQA